jgi:hypothetical protein
MLATTRRTLRSRPIDRLTEEREVMRALPEREPDVDRRWVTRVPPDPHVRVDTNDYSLDPRLVGRRVEVRVSQRRGIERGDLLVEPLEPPPSLSEDDLRLEANIAISRRVDLHRPVLG